MEKKRNKLKKFFVGVLYLLAVLAVLVVVAFLSTVLMHFVWVPLLGESSATVVMTVLSMIGGGAVGHLAAIHWDDVAEWFGLC